MTKSANTPARRVLPLVIGAALTATALPATAGERTVIEQLPTQISKSAFQSLSGPELYQIDIAHKRGQRVQIGDYSPSQSRAAVDKALISGETNGVSRNTLGTSGNKTGSPHFPGTTPNPR